MKRFELDGTSYTCDAETLEMVRLGINLYKEKGCKAVIAAVMALGLKAGRIVEEA